MRQRVFHQIMMHRAGGYQRATGTPDHRTVAEDREAVAVLNRLRCFLANAINRLAHADALRFREGDVDLLRAPTAIIHAPGACKSSLVKSGAASSAVCAWPSVVSE